VTKPKLSSFVSDHSAEYLLVPAITKVLRAEYSTIVPLYFWLSREGGLHARETHEGSPFRAVALFPRRPKFELGKHRRIYVTINESLKESALVLRNRGIPSLVGCPIIESFWQIDEEPRCVFLAIDDDTLSQYSFDAEMTISNDRSTILLSNAELITYVSKHAERTDLNELLLAVRASRSPDQSRIGVGAKMFSSVYKPVILLLRQ